MTAIADFVADPKHFLRNNILRCRGTMPAGVTSIRSFKFQAMHYTGTKLSDGRAIPVYELVPIVDQGERIRLRGNPAAANRDYLNAYWCPYFQDSYHAITVDSAADFMFTPNMDGCSFGVGSDTPSGARRVAHINLASQPNSRNLQNQTLRVDGLDDRIVNPNKYMKSSRAPDAIAGQIKITTVGIRNTANSRWSFYYQQHRQPMLFDNQVFLLSLKRV